eukprot:SAG22_NODE_17758_length_299_cov_0.670000_1_plen_75_part_10
MRFGTKRKIGVGALFLAALYVFRNQPETRLDSTRAAGARGAAGCGAVPAGGRKTYMDISAGGCAPCSDCAESGLV